MHSAELSSRDARRAHLVAQGLLGSRPIGGPKAVLGLTRGVQLDTISVLARSHELVAFARLGRVSRRTIESAYWGGPPFSAFEYWYHAACVVPIEEWPNLGFKRKARRERGFRWHRLDDLEPVCERILARVADEGPLTANELGGAKQGGPWWDWSETKIAAEWLLDIGELVCTTRRRYQRVYDLPERAVPHEHLVGDVARPDAIRALAARAVGALGVATARDVSSYIGAPQREVAAALLELGLEQVRVEGWKAVGFVAPRVLDSPLVSGTRRAGPVLLSPFDSVVCDRHRLERLFGFWHRLEAYVPRPKRVHGYYTMPVLDGDRFVARVDPKREGTTLVARRVFVEPARTKRELDRAARATARALRRAASWVGCDDLRVEHTDPPALGPLLGAAARHEGLEESQPAPG